MSTIDLIGDGKPLRSMLVVLLAALSVGLWLPHPAAAKVEVKLEKQKVALDADVELDITGLKAKTTYVIEVSTGESTVANCAASGTYENGQVIENASATSDKKGELKHTLTPQSALGVNWCQGKYAGRIAQKGQKKSVASFTFKAIVGG